MLGGYTNNNLVFVLLFANFVYLILIISTLGIFASVRKGMRKQKERQSFHTTLAVEEKSTDLATVSNFLFLELSLICRLASCAVILAHLMGLMKTSDG